MPPAAAPAPPAPVTVVVGGEEFLLAREVERVLAAARAQDPDCQVTDVAADSFTDEHVLGLSSPDLFGVTRALVVRGVQELDDMHREALVSYAADPQPDLVLLLVHATGNKARGFPEQLQRAGARLVRVSAPSRPADRLEFLKAEIRAAGGQCTEGAARALAEAVGSDLRELAAAGRQLVADTGGRVDEEAVARFHLGRAEFTGFVVADAALGGQPAEALALLRGALDSGLAPVLISSALATGLRELVRVREESGRKEAVAAALGMPLWKVDKALRLARGWSEEGLVEAVAAAAVADAGVKGAATDSGYALTRAILALHAARQRGGPAARRPGRAPR